VVKVPAWKPDENHVQEVIPVKRKTPYSLVDVNRVSIESIVSSRAGQPSIVGVDVAKDQHAACLYWPDRSFERPWRVESPGQIGLLVEKLVELSRSCPLVVALESSGTYGDVLRQALSDRGIEVQRVSRGRTKGSLSFSALTFARAVGPIHRQAIGLDPHA
jgi:hypothetical protein